MLAARSTKRSLREKRRTLAKRKGLGGWLAIDSCRDLLREGWVQAICVEVLRQNVPSLCFSPDWVSKQGDAIRTDFSWKGVYKIRSSSQHFLSLLHSSPHPAPDLHFTSPGFSQLSPWAEVCHALSNKVLRPRKYHPYPIGLSYTWGLRFDGSAVEEKGLKKV